MDTIMELKGVVDRRDISSLPDVRIYAEGIHVPMSYKWASVPERVSHDSYIELSLDVDDIGRLFRLFAAEIGASITVLRDEPGFQDALCSRLYPGRERKEGTRIGVRATQRLGFRDRGLEVGYAEFVDGESINPEFRYSEQEAAIKNLMLALEEVPGVDVVGDVPALIYNMLQDSQHRISDYSIQGGYAEDETRAFERYKRMSLGRLC